MNHRNHKKLASLAVLSTGLLWAGSCGVTTLQLNDFLSSTIIRVGVQSVAALIEATLTNQSQDTTSGAP